ncbi:hypothetical protein N7470_009075 [Penicillium chermesinum]|nr:hypothetical protein N7470_009075 [Penicillium chermesinum]
MPRLPTRLLLESYRENPLLALLLKECRSLDSARNELRWLRERALRSGSRHAGWQMRLKAMCHRRSKGVPLQYLLGDQPFGDLEILCRRGVLIPRSDTESYTFQAAKLVRQMALERSGEDKNPRYSNPLRILDLCTGTGCIALLLHALLAPLLTRRALVDVQFHQANVLGPDGGSPVPSIEDILCNWDSSHKISRSGPKSDGCDLLISNPPYISDADFRNGTTSRSVRLFEPRLALVPPSSHRVSPGVLPEDIFYYHILVQSLKLKAKITVLECGDIRQAQRVIKMHRILSSGHEDDFRAGLWPDTEQDMLANGFHPHAGSRGVIIQRQI